MSDPFKKGTKVIIINDKSVSIDIIDYYDGNWYGIKGRKSVPREFVRKFNKENIQTAIEKLEHIIIKEKETVQESRKQIRRSQYMLKKFKSI